MLAVKFYDSSIDNRVPQEVISNVDVAPTGYSLYSEDDFKAYIDSIPDALDMFKNLKENEAIINRQVVDISETPEYIQKKQVEHVAKLQEDYMKKIDAITSANLLNENMLQAGLITQSIFDSRLAKNIALGLSTYNEFFTLTGIPKPVIGE